MRKIWIAVACVLVVVLISVPMVLLAENIRYSKVYFSNDLFSFVGNSTEEIYEITIFNAKTLETTSFRDTDLIATLEQTLDGLVFREQQKPGGGTVGMSNTVVIKTSHGSEIRFSYASYSIRMEGKQYLCNTNKLSVALDELFSSTLQSE